MRKPAGITKRGEPKEALGPTGWTKLPAATAEDRSNSTEQMAVDAEAGQYAAPHISNCRGSIGIRLGKRGRLRFGPS